MARRKQAWSGWGAPAMKRVAGWDFDHRLNGYITTAADRFSCDCGEEFATPSGYRKCGSCGRAWNSYVIGSDSHGKEAALEKVIVREIPVRKDVIVASKRRQAHRRKAESGYNAFDAWHAWSGSGEDTGSSEDIHGSALRDFADHGEYLKDPKGWWQSHSPEAGWAANSLHKEFPFIDNVNGKDTYNPNWLSEKKWTSFGGGQFVRKDPPKRRRQAKGDCTCWDGYERVPGTKPCASGSCRKKAARRYVAWCRQVDRRPTPGGMRRFLTAERLVRLASRHTAGDEPFKDFQYSPGMWQGIHKHYYYPDRIPKIHDYDQFRKDNPHWFNEDGSPNPPPMEDSNPWSMSSRKIAPPMNMSPRSKYLPPNKFDSSDYSYASQSYYPSDVYERLTPEEIKQHWPEIPQEEWVGYPGSKTPGGTPFRTRTPYEPGRWKYYAPGHETGMPALPSAMPKKVKPKPVDPSSAESGLMMARRQADRHTLRRIDLQEQEPEPEQDTVSIEHFSSRRRRAELFDITEEGETSKGKGKKSNTPTMRKNPDTWTKHKQNGQFSKRWN